MQFSNALPVDTILVYHLLAYTDGTDKGGLDVKREFDKIHRQFNKKFYNSNFQDLKRDTTIQGGVHNYFIGSSNVSPVSIAWGKVKDEFVLNLILRIKAKQNLAILPAAFYNP